MQAGVTIRRGQLPDGTTYRVWRRYDGWTRCYICINDKEHRRSMSWLKKQLKVQDDR